MHPPSSPQTVPPADEIKALREEIQQLRKRIMKYAEEADTLAGLDSLRNHPFEPLDFRLSRGYRIWKMYLRLYDLPVLGAILTASRATIGKLVRLLRRQN